MRKRRTEITIETHEVSIIRRRGRIVRARCATCAGQVEAVTIDEATALTRINSRLIYRWVEAGSIHFTESPEGFLLICFNSLLALLDGNN